MKQNLHDLFEKNRRLQRECLFVELSLLFSWVFFICYIIVHSGVTP